LEENYSHWRRSLSKNQPKASRMISLSDEQNKLGLMQAAAAAYTNTSTTINGTKLIQGQVDHIV